jgi:hypothetical protein
MTAGNVFRDKQRRLYRVSQNRLEKRFEFIAFRRLAYSGHAVVSKLPLVERHP